MTPFLFFLHLLVGPTALKGASLRVGFFPSLLVMLCAKPVHFRDFETCVSGFFEWSLSVLWVMLMYSRLVRDALVCA